MSYRFKTAIVGLGVITCAMLSASAISPPLAAQDKAKERADLENPSANADRGGIETPLKTLNVAGDIHASGVIKSGNSLTFDGQLHKITATTTSGVNAPFSKQIRIGFEEIGNLSPFSDIKVGVGTLTPTDTLDVDGRARIRTLPPGAITDSVVMANGTGNLRKIPVSALASGNAWSLGGNTITPANFIGTLNLMPFIVNTGGAGAPFERMRVTPTGRVGIGTPIPSLDLEVRRLTNPVMGISSPTALGRFGIASCAGCFSSVAAVNDFVLGSGGLLVRDLLLNSASDDPLGGAIRFTTGTISGGDTEKMRLTKAGDLGVGTTSPTARTEISHSDLTPNTVALRISNTTTNAAAFTESGIGFRVAVNGGTAQTRIYSKYDGTWVGDGRISMQVMDGGGGSPYVPPALRDVLNVKNGSVGVNTITPQNPLHVVGTVRLGLATGGTPLCYTGITTSAVIADCTPSDARLKTKVLPLANTLDKLEHVRGVSFQWNDQYRSRSKLSDRREIGVLAQEVEGVFPELISVTGEGHKRVDYDRLAAVLIEAVKELRKENDALKRRTEALERALTKP